MRKNSIRKIALVSTVCGNFRLPNEPEKPQSSYIKIIAISALDFST